jgi:hypothetical protein
MRSLNSGQGEVLAFGRRCLPRTPISCSFLLIVKYPMSRARVGMFLLYLALLSLGRIARALSFMTITKSNAWLSRANFI